MEQEKKPAETTGAEAPRQKPRRNTYAGKIGRGLGRLARRARETEIWSKTEQAYKDGLEGKL